MCVYKSAKLSGGRVKIVSFYSFMATSNGGRVKGWRYVIHLAAR
jgi:hypothetical protein